MADDFMKQLQLSKQIEQKAKEAAKNRKTAEEKIKEAETALNVARSSNGNVEEAQRLFDEASAAFKDKDYVKSLASAKKSIEASYSAESAMAEETAAQTVELIAIMKGHGEDTATFEEALTGVRRSIEEGRFEEAVSTVKDTKEKVTSVLAEFAARMIAETEGDILIAERFQMGPDKERDLLDQARKAMDMGGYGESIASIDLCRVTLDERMKSNFISRFDRVIELQGYSIDNFFNFDKANERLYDAQHGSDAHDIAAMFTAVDEAELEVKKSLSDGIESFLQSVEKRASTIDAEGADASLLHHLIDVTRSDIASADFQKANGDMKALRQSVLDLEIMIIASTVARWNTKVRIARMIKADLTPVANGMDEVKATVLGGDLAAAMEKANQVHQTLDQILSGYREVETSLEDYRSIMERGKDLGLNTSEAEATMTLARKSALHRDFSRAAALLTESTKDTQNAIQAHYGKIVIKIEITLASAMRMQADVSSESDQLDQLVNKIKKNEFGIVDMELRELEERAVQRVKDTATKVVSESRKAIEAYKGSMDLSDAQASIDRATEALGSGNYALAYDLSKEATEAVKKEEIQLLEMRMIEAGRMLAIMKELECESITLKEKMSKAHELRSNRQFNEAMRLTNEVIHFASSIIKDDLSRQMTNVGKAISISRKKGIGVNGPERIMEEAWRLLNQERTEESYNLMRQALDQLRSTNAQHAEIYNLLADVRSMMHEASAKGHDVKKAETMLEKARRLFEMDKYAEAKEAGQAAHAEAERLAAQFIAPKRMAETTEMLNLAYRMKLNTTKGENLLARADDLLAVQDNVRALAAIKEAKEQVTALMAEGLTRDISVSKATLLKSKEKGLDITASEMMVQKAESLLEEGHYNDAWRAVELAKNELDQSTFMEQKASDCTEQAERTIKDVGELGLDASTAKEVLRQAKFFLSQGNFTLATELGKKSSIIASDIAENMVNDKLEEAEERTQLTGLNQHDLSSLARKRDNIKQLVTQRHFKEAMFLIGPYEEELANLQRNRDSAQRELSELESKSKGLESAGMLSDHAKKFLAEAQEKFREGSFSESRSLIARCNEDLSSLGEMYESRHRELSTLREEFGFLGDEKRRSNVGSLLDQAESALKRLDFEKTSLFLRRARAATLEATGYEVGRHFEDLMVLNRILEKQGISRGTSEVRDGQATKMYEIKPKDLVRLRSEIMSLREVIINGLRDRVSKMREELDRASEMGKDVSASNLLLERIEPMIEEANLEEAFDSLAESRRLIGMPKESWSHIQEESRSLQAMIAKVRPTGIDISDIEVQQKKFEAGMIKDPEAALNGLQNLKKRLEKQIETLQPEIGIDIDFLDEPSFERWAKILIKMTNQGASPATNINMKLNGPIDVQGNTSLAKLSPGETVVMRLEVFPKIRGRIVVMLGLECTSLISDRSCGYDSEFEMQID